MKVAIIGGTGFVGSALGRVLTDEAHEVVSASRRAAPAFDVEDTGTLHQFLAAAGPDVVVHVAGVTDRAECEADPGRAWRVQALACRVAAGWCAQRSARLVLVSCAEVFGSGCGPHRESDEPDPVGAYAASAFLAEREVLARPGGLVVRADVLGGGGDPWVGVARMLRDGGIVAASERSVRAPLHVADLAGSVARLIASGTEGLIHAGGDDALTEADFARAACKRFPVGTLRVCDASSPIDRRLDASLMHRLIDVDGRDLGATVATVLDAVAAEQP